MNPFAYQRASTPQDAVHAATASAKFLAGGTNLIDLMKDNVERPNTLVDINHLALTEVTGTSAGGLMIGALVRNADLAGHPLVLAQYPMLSLALLSGASPQLRNRATTGGNLMQRTRCPYFMDEAFTACNKRSPGSGCGAREGYNRMHAILGQTDDGPHSAHTCIAVNPSDMNVALAALGATVHIQGQKGKRTLPVREFHRLPGRTPQSDTNLAPGELITAVELPQSRFVRNFTDLKIRDRQSYAFALVSVAAGLEVNNGNIVSAALALGGIAHKPWHSPEAERVLIHEPATAQSYRKAADLALANAKGYEHNAFKIELAKQAIVRALTQAAQGQPLS